jgi:hypothetical protein
MIGELNVSELNEVNLLGVNLISSPTKMKELLYRKVYIIKHKD